MLHIMDLFHPNVPMGQIVPSTNMDKPFPKQALFFTCLQYNIFLNTVGKGEIARD